MTLIETWTDRASVPCNGCTLCCQKDAIVLLPERGDDISQYKHSIVDGVPMVNKVDGHCVYLIDGKCSIWDRAPFMCRLFDCRLWYLSKTRAERRRLVKSGHADREVFDAGRARLDSLDSPRQGT